MLRNDGAKPIDNRRVTTSPNSHQLTISKIFVRFANIRTSEPSSKAQIQESADWTKHQSLIRSVSKSKRVANLMMRFAIRACPQTKIKV
ncbi:MAG: hypothetical protein LBH99_00065 [Rickettsia sp.]|nr:hypothetical protein [Rickettsia sp.]